MSELIEIDVTPDEVFRYFDEAAAVRDFKIAKAARVQQAQAPQAAPARAPEAQRAPPKPGSNDGGLGGLIAGAMAFSYLSQ